MHKKFKKSFSVLLIALLFIELGVSLMPGFAPTAYADWSDSFADAALARTSDQSRKNQEDRNIAAGFWACMTLLKSSVTSSELNDKSVFNEPDQGGIGMSKYFSDWGGDGKAQCKTLANMAPQVVGKTYQNFIDDVFPSSNASGDYTSMSVDGKNKWNDSDGYLADFYNAHPMGPQEFTLRFEFVFKRCWRKDERPRKTGEGAWSANGNNWYLADNKDSEDNSEPIGHDIDDKGNIQCKTLKGIETKYKLLGTVAGIKEAAQTQGKINAVKVVLEDNKDVVKFCYAGVFGSVPSGFPTDTDLTNIATWIISGSTDVQKAKVADCLRAAPQTAAAIADAASTEVPVGAAPEQVDTSGADNTCESAGDIAWILCPVVKAISSAGNWLTSQISALLEVDRDRFAGKETYNAWVVIRNVALTALIAMMMVMVIGTALGTQAFDAYTVKRALPRMVAAIFFIVFSWYACVALIDIFNAAGSGVLGLMSRPFNGGNLELTDIFEIGIGTFLTNAVGSVALTIGLILVLVFFGSTILLFVGIAFLTLILRQIFIITLLLLAPLAILAWIFPGNDKLWKTWWGSFSKLLMMYPLIMALIAVGRIFAYLFNPSGGGGSSGASGAVLDPLLAMLAYTLPFAFIPFTFKTAGGLFATVSGMANDRSKGLFDRAKKRRGEKAQRWAAGNAIKTAPEGSRRAMLNRRIEQAANVQKAGIDPRHMRTRLNNALNNSAESEIEHILKDSEFAEWSGDDEKVWAAKYHTREEISKELANRDASRFGTAKRDDGSIDTERTKNNKLANDQATEQILRSQQKYGNEAFQRARLRQQAKTGTGYRDPKTKEFNSALMLQDINDVYGSDRNGAGKALAEMRSVLANSGQIAGMAGYGTWAGEMENVYNANQSGDKATIEAQQRKSHEAIMEDTISSVAPSQAMYGKPDSAREVGRAHARRIEGIAQKIKAKKINPATMDKDAQGKVIEGTGRAWNNDDLSAAVAAAAGLYDAMAQVAPQNANAMAETLMKVELDVEIPNVQGKPVTDPTTGAVRMNGTGEDAEPIRAPITVHDLIDNQMGGNTEFTVRRKDFSVAAYRQAEAARAAQNPPTGSTGPGGPPITGIPPVGGSFT